MNKKKTVSEGGKINKDYSISCTRFIAMCFIVLCHVMQRDGFASNIKGAHIEWAFWFNVGVQMFLFISGFLYGKKDRIDIVEFYKKSFSKLLIDYYVFICAMLLLIHKLPLMSIDKNGVLSLLTFYETIPGLGHLWFVPTILFCYLFTPIYAEIIKAIDKHSDKRFFVESIILVFIVHMVVKIFFGMFSAAWINCFVIGRLYSKVEERKYLRTTFNILSLITCLVIIPVQFRIDYWSHTDLPDFFASRYSYLTQYGHVFLGIVLVVLFRFIYNKRESRVKNHYVLNWSDKYSYDVYLVHHVFVQSAFGCVEYISNRVLAIPLAITLTIITAMLLYRISAFVRNKCILVYRWIPN